MAEAREEDQPPSLPPRGRVESVRKQWSVHEDGALAYQMQNEEINQHYGFNRFNRRTVREDIPVAKIVQTEEELRQQEERMRELEELKAQAEKDEMVARQISEQLKHDVQDTRSTRVLDDEELARQMQEKEKKKYERHLEKKREKRLKQERQRLEAELARNTEEAGLQVNSETSSDHVADSMESLNVQDANTRRVTPAGKIEDEGDFSDFYRLPDEMDEFTRLEIQASQDEELARLLQEQEHKRSKAEVDRSKLKRIEQQDEELAKVMQEQEKIRLKKAKQKHHQKKEAQKLKASESLPLGASANTMSMEQPISKTSMSSQQHSPHSISPTIPIAGATRYRRNSYTQAFDSPPSPPRSQPPPRPASGKNRQEPQDQNVWNQHQAPFSSSPSSQIPLSSSIPHSTSVQRNPPQQQQQHYQQQPPPHLLANRPPMPLPSHSTAQGMSTLESARRIAAGDHNGILAAQQRSMSSPRMGNSSSREGTGTNVDVIRSSGRGRGQHVKLVSSQSLGMASSVDPVPHHLSQEDYRYQQQYPDDRFEDDMPDVTQWVDAQDEFGTGMRVGNHPSQYQQQPRQQQQQQQQWQHATSYSDEEDDFGSHHQGSPHVNGSTGFNIATAIDPTYQKRHPQAAIFPPDETQVKRVIPFSRSLPQADGEVEWDPGLRGSLRKTKAPIHGYQDSSSVSSMGGASGDPSWQPVQGQRRGDTRSKKSSKQKAPGTQTAEGKKDKSGNCKQQ